TYEAKFRKFASLLRGRVIPGNNIDHEMSEEDWDMVEQRIAEMEQFEVNIKNLEDEKFKTMQEHQIEKSRIMEEHQNALINAANRIAAAEGMIDQLNKMPRTAERQESSSMGLTVSPEPIGSPSGGKRGYDGISVQIPAKKRMRRQAARKA
ncbi:hypothetical protein AOQ84DRAFT_364549, partial [Glonium stellatum]